MFDTLTVKIPNKSITFKNSKVILGLKVSKFKLIYKLEKVVSFNLNKKI